MYNVSLFNEIAQKIADGRVWVATCVRNETVAWKIVFTASEILYREPEDLNVDQVCSLSPEPYDLLLDLWRTRFNAEAINDGEDLILVESFGKRKHLVICGAGHVALALIKMAKIVGFQVTSLEDRMYFSNMAKEAGADQVICNSFDQGLREVTSTEDTCFVIMTRGHRFDEMCLREIFQKPYAYIGMMGSKGRALNVRHDMEREGIGPEKLAALHAPIGMEIGAQTPAEIAVSVMSELINFLRSNDRAIDDGIESVIQGAIDPTQEGVGKVMATIVSKRGATPRTVGTKMMVFGTGRITGTIGGGCAEADVITQARAMIQEEREKGSAAVASRIVNVDLTGAQGFEEDAMHCGGIQDVLLELVAD